jgi:hypothetical protein
MTHAGRSYHVLVLATAVGLSSAVAAAAEGIPAPVKWDPVASEQLAEALHHMHVVWNAGDIKGLKALIAGDEQLVTFELSPAGHTPIRLRSKNDLDKFVDDVNNYLAKEKAVTVLDPPTVKCRALPNMGVCTEECTIHIKKDDGSERIDRLWSTNVAVKQPDGWKWIQWHMSVGTPSQLLKGSGAGSE